MTPEFRKHLRKEVLTNSVSNALFNGVIAWLLLKGGDDLDLYKNVIGDVLATSFILSFIVGLIIVPLNRRLVQKGKISALTLDQHGLHKWIRRLPFETWKAGLCFALAASIFIGGATVLILIALNAGPFTPMEYAIFKGIWAGFLASIITWPMVLFALATKK